MRALALTLLLAATTCVPPIAAQTAPLPSAAPRVAAGRGGAYVQAGGAWSGLVDRNASALHYRGPGVGAATGWRSIHDNTRVELGVAGSVSRLTSRISTAGTNRESALGLEMRIAVLRRIASLERADVAFFAGGQILVHGLGREHRFPHGATEKFADVFGTLSTAASWEYSHGSGTVLSGTAALPLASVVGRTPYYGLKATPEFRLAGPASFTAVSHALRVEKPVSPRTTLLLDYRATLQRDDRPQELRRIEHWVGTGLELRRSAR